MGKLLSALLGLVAFAGPVAAAEPPALYAEHCAACHGADRLGGMGPALLPELLAPQGVAKVAAIVATGKAATQMPGFGATLAADDVAGLAGWLIQDWPQVPTWGMNEIRASRTQAVALADLPAKPAYAADPLNLFTVVEAGDHAVTILDGDRFEPLARFPSRFALHGGAKYSPDGRFVYLGSRDGWITLYDLYSLKVVAEVRAGLNMRNVAVSADGRFVIAGNTLPRTLAIFDAHDLTPLKVIDVVGDHGQTSRVSAVYTAPPRKSFIVALKDLPEVWEISTDEHSKPTYPGFVHNYDPTMIEALGSQQGLFSVRRIRLDEDLDDFFFDQSYTNLIGAARDGHNGQVVNLIVGRKTGEIALAGMPHLGSGITFEYEGRPVLATPHLKEAAVSVIDMKTWATIARIDTNGPGFFMRSHDNTPYAWVDGSLGRNRDTVQVIDKRTLKIVTSLTPSPGKTAAHVEFTRDGRYALLSVSEMDGALVVYDAATFVEVKRIPMKKPVGKYNVFNKINYSSGTSH